MESAFNAEAAARGIININDNKASDAGNVDHASVPMETLNALRSGWASAGSTARSGSHINSNSNGSGIVTLGDFKRYHQVRTETRVLLPSATNWS